MKKAKLFFILGAIFAIITSIFTLAISRVDVTEYCYNDGRYDNLPETTNLDHVDIQCKPIGFSSVNLPINEQFPFNETLYNITEIAGLVPIVFASIYGLTGIVQLLKRKNLFKVNHEIIALGGLFAVAFGSYLLFNKFALNYRPVLMDGELESSFPSSHTMLILCICFGIIITNLMFYKNVKRLKIVNAILIFSAAFIVVGRFLSGAHWATDIFGGLLYASTYLLLYRASLLIVRGNKSKLESKQKSE